MTDDNIKPHERRRTGIELVEQYVENEPRIYEMILWELLFLLEAGTLCIIR